MDMNTDDAPATKGDLKNVQGDLLAVQRAVRRIAIQAVKTHAHLDKQVGLLRGEMNAMSSRLTKQFDGFIAETGKIDRAQIIADWRVAQLEQRVDKIETRPS